MCHVDTASSPAPLFRETAVAHNLAVVELRARSTVAPRGMYVPTRCISTDTVPVRTYRS